jgi:inorganic pyrophosphatase/exopolyphosphatase
MEGDITLIYLIDSGNDNKYRVYHSELDDWIVNGSELQEDILKQLNEYVNELVRVVTVIGIVNNINKRSIVMEIEVVNNES